MPVFALIFIPYFSFLYHFDTVLGPFFGLGGRVGGGGVELTPFIPMELWRGKNIFDLVGFKPNIS